MGKIKDQIKEKWTGFDSETKFNVAFGVTDVITGAISLAVLIATFLKKDDAEENKEND